MVAALTPHVAYSGSHRSAQWRGKVVKNSNKFRSYIKGRVQSRIDDEETQNSFSSELRGMVTTKMTSEFIEKLLWAVPENKSWEIGEAFAECVLSDDKTREIYWPWNSTRDRRTPRASLPGADLVGFHKKNGKVIFLFGEVKTSGDTRSPPGVMKGKRGLTQQLEKVSTCHDIQRALLTWLQARCKSPEYRKLYNKAIKRYFRSQGRDILLVGTLLRDTKSNELDVTHGAKTLGNNVNTSTRVEITAWYLPDPINSWPTLLDRNTP